MKSVRQTRLDSRRSRLSPSERTKRKRVGSNVIPFKSSQKPSEEQPAPIKVDGDISSTMTSLSAILEALNTIPMHIEPCSRTKATTIQRRLYAINKDGIRSYATRYSYEHGGLMIWRMK